MRYLLSILFLIGGVVFGQSALHTSLVGYWDFNEPSGTTLIDLVSTNDGTVTGATVNQTGKIDKAYPFDGSDYITLPDNGTMSFYNTNLTIACWVYLTAYPSTNNEYAIIGGDDYSAGMAINQNGYLFYTEAAYDSATVGATTRIPLDQWVHVGVTFNYSTHVVQYYVNGSASGTATMSGSVILDASSNKIGDGWWSSDYFIGKIDELGYWKTILSAALFDTLYRGPDGVGTDGYAYPFTTEIGVTLEPGQVLTYFNSVAIGLFNKKFGGGDSLKTYLNPYVAPAGEDTIEYWLYDNFESWTNASVQSYDSLIERIPMSGYFMPAQQSIVNFGGEHQNTWQSSMLDRGATSMEYYMPLGDTASDLWFSYDLYVASNFNNIGIGGVASHKFPGGFEGGDDLDLNAGNPAYGRSGIDSINLLAGRGGWTGLVSGHANDDLMAYPYGQPPIGSTNWYGAPSAGYGYFELPYGYWLNITIHHRVNTPGQYDGFTEIYLDGVLDIMHPGQKWRSVQQGEDYGKIEQLRMEYFFGSGTGDERNSNGVNTIWMDNWVVYQYKSGSQKYGDAQGTVGVTRCPIIRPPIAGRLMPADNQLDETYTAVSDTIYDVGKDKGYLYWPAFKKAEITKEVTLPSGTINYAFVSEQFGMDWPDECAYVKVYSGTGGGKVLLATFGRSSGCGYTDPSGTYSIADNEATFVIYPGSTYGYTKGISIRYWQP